MENWGERTVNTLNAIRQKKPLIHNITNFVVMNSTANVILAVGASPVMAHAREEVEEMAGYAGAVVLNIGTLEPEWIDSMVLAGKAANRLNIPVIFDPVGVGATIYRSRAASRILEEVKCDVIRGNASEILSLAGMKAKIRGVDSLMEVDGLTSDILTIARQLKTVIAVTGVEDLVCDGRTCLEISGGDEMFRRVTGTGCAASAVCACFVAVDPDHLNASVQALAYYGVAGKEAAQRVRGPGSFQVALLDALALVDSQTLKSSIKVRKLI
ncbi:hydroxyethylthiazole kinase [bacterium]|nr:hydroxyethylthiazole kinase [candidate division CSSED10-310 bacterium]